MSPAANEHRVAVIDVGSNSVRLLVADMVAGQANVVYTGKVTCRLLAGMQGDMLADASIARTRRAIETLAEQARALGAHEVIAFGTSAMRDGANSAVLIDAARAIHVPLEILSGTDEARIAYRGAAPEGRCGVLDIGGGSTETLIGADGAVLASCSVRVGAVRLSEQLQGALAVDAMLDRAHDTLLPAWERLKAHTVHRWVGVGGTITSLAAMSLRLTAYDARALEGYPLTRAQVVDWHARLSAMPLEARKRLHGLNPERADIIPFGTAILRAWMELAQIDAIHATDRDNLLGYLYAKRG